MCGISMKDRTTEELRKMVGVEPNTTVIRSGRLRWYGHVMRKGLGEEFFFNFFYRKNFIQKKILQKSTVLKL